MKLGVENREGQTTERPEDGHDPLAQLIPMQRPLSQEPEDGEFEGFTLRAHSNHLSLRCCLDWAYVSNKAFFRYIESLRNLIWESDRFQTEEVVAGKNWARKAKSAIFEGLQCARIDIFPEVPTLSASIF